MPIPSPADFRNKSKKHSEVREMLAQMAEDVESKTDATTKANAAEANAIAAAATDATTKANAAQANAIAAAATDATTKANAAEANAKSYTDQKTPVIAYKYNNDGSLINSFSLEYQGKFIGFSGSITNKADSAAKVTKVTAGDRLFIHNSTNRVDGTGYAIYNFYDGDPFVATQARIVHARKLVTINGVLFDEVVVPAGSNTLVVNTKYDSIVHQWAVFKNYPSSDFTTGAFTISDVNGRKIDTGITPETAAYLSKNGTPDEMYVAGNVVPDVYITGTGAIGVSAGFTMLAMKVKANEKYFISLPASRANGFKAIYSKSAYVISGTPGLENVVSDIVFESSADESVYSFTVPNNPEIRHVFINLKMIGGGFNFDITNGLSIQKGGFLHSKKGSTGKSVDNINGSELVDSAAREALLSISGFAGRPVSRMANKKVIAFGDSITAGDYAQYMTLAFGTGVNIKASVGATSGRLVDIMTAGEGLPRRDSATAGTTWAPIDFTDLACATILIGINEAPLTNAGSLSELPTDLPKDNFNKLNFWAKFNNNYIGNLALMVEFLQWKAPQAEIHLISPIHINAGVGKQREAALALRDAMKSVAEYYSVHFIDATNESGITFKYMLDTAQTLSIDGVHLTPLGNEKLGTFMAQKVLSFG